MSKVEKRVRAGIQFLDKQYGRKWREKVDLDRLNMVSCFDCLLGQIMENYDSHLKKLGLTSDRAADLGFDLSTEDIFSMWQDLTQTWRRVLRKEGK